MSVEMVDSDDGFVHVLKLPLHQLVALWDMMESARFDQGFTMTMEREAVRAEIGAALDGVVEWHVWAGSVHIASAMVRDSALFEARNVLEQVVDYDLSNYDLYLLRLVPSLDID